MMHAWFLALADTENVSDAAAHLGMSQPTLSRRLARLEHDVGTPLFDRPGRRIVLNEAGRVYAEAARRADLTMEVARQRIGELAGAGDALRLGFLHSFGSWLVPDVLREVRAADPHVHLHLVQDAAETICRLVREGDLDVGLVSPRPRPDGVLAWRVLHAQPVALAVPADHPLGASAGVTLAQLRNEAFVTMPAHYGMRQVLDDACADAGFTPRVTTECQELGTVRGLVSAGLGVALLPVTDGPTAAAAAADHTATHPVAAATTARASVDGAEPTDTSPPVGSSSVTVPATVRADADGVCLVPITDPPLTRDIGVVWRRDRALGASARLVRDAPARATRLS